MNNHKLACNDVLQTLILFIDQELPSAEQYPLFEIHFQECPNCLEILEHERAALNFLQSLLQSSCNEIAPDELKERIAASIDSLAMTTSVEFFSQTTITEFTFDGTTSIEITQEFTQEIRHEFPNE
jgi:mycothiol system anti-sigma-R factor